MGDDDDTKILGPQLMLVLERRCFGPLRELRVKFTEDTETLQRNNTALWKQYNELAEAVNQLRGELQRMGRDVPPPAHQVEPPRPRSAPDPAKDPVRAGLGKILVAIAGAITVLSAGAAAYYFGLSS